MNDLRHRRIDVAVNSSPVKLNPFRRFVCLLIPGVVLLLAFLLRHHQLSGVSAWFDESFECRMVEFSPTEILARSERDPQAPLHFFVLWIWHLVFGPTLSSLRYCSLLFGLLTVVGAYFLGTASARPGASGCTQGKFAGALASLFIALSPVHIYWSQTVKTYSMGACFAIWSSWLLLTWLQHRDSWRLVLYVPVAAALTLQHHFGTFTVFAQLTFSLCWTVVEFRRTKDKSSLQATVIAGWVTTSIWSIWLPTLLTQRAAVKRSFWMSRFTWSDLSDVCGRLFTENTSIRHDPDHALILFELSFVAVLLMLLSRNVAARFSGWLAFVTYFIAAFVSVLDQNLMVSRYLVNFHLFLMVGVAILVAHSKKFYLRAVSAFLIAACLLTTAVLQHRERSRQADCTGMKEIVQLLDSVRPSDEPLLVCNPMLFLNVKVHGPHLDRIFSWGQKEQFPSFQGTAVMRDAEYFSTSELRQESGRWVWTLDAEEWFGRTWAVELPPEWKVRDERRAREWYATLVLRAYERVED